jgi:hypothetical protein
MRIGLVDIDTSHPQNWIPIERDELGHEVIGLWDAGAVHPADYVEQFAKERDLRIFGSIAEMVPEVDCAIIHGCDWDTHIDKARPFVEAGKSVLIDKPMAGNYRDIRQIVDWVGQGARITGGSSLRFCYEVQEYNAKPVEERGTPDTIFAGCGVDEFNYGIHAYSLLLGLMGPGAVSVKHLGKGVQTRIQINWPEGRVGYLTIGEAKKWIPFYATVVTELGCKHIETDNSNNRLYRALLEQTLPYLAGETDTPPIPIADLVQAELCAVAASQSWINGDAEVKLSDLSDSSPAYNGPVFAEGYRKQRYPNS